MRTQSVVKYLSFVATVVCALLRKSEIYKIWQEADEPPTGSLKLPVALFTLGPGERVERCALLCSLSESTG